METTPQSQSQPPEVAPTLSLGARFVAMFSRPTQAWAGLERRGQWWFPLLITILVGVVGMALIYDRAMLPTQLEQFQRQVEEGRYPPAALERVEDQLTSPVVRVMNVGALIIMVPLMALATALLPWVAAGFILGHRFRYRDAFVVTAWAGVIALPAQLLTYVLAWVNESMTDLHIGFGALLPVEDPPSKLMHGLGFFLDYGIGPLYIWYVAVLVLGTAALSGAPRRRLAFTVGGLWVVVLAVIAVLGAVFGPGA
jgi:hypothetical protein